MTNIIAEIQKRREEAMVRYNRVLKDGEGRLAQLLIERIKVYDEVLELADSQGPNAWSL